VVRSSCPFQCLAPRSCAAFGNVCSHIVPIFFGVPPQDVTDSLGAPAVTGKLPPSLRFRINSELPTMWDLVAGIIKTCGSGEIPSSRLDGESKGACFTLAISFVARASLLLGLAGVSRQGRFDDGTDLHSERTFGSG
jgi:hypothetical protein